MIRNDLIGRSQFTIALLRGVAVAVVHKANDCEGGSIVLYGLVSHPQAMSTASNNAMDRIGIPWPSLEPHQGSKA